MTKCVVSLICQLYVKEYSRDVKPQVSPHTVNSRLATIEQEREKNKVKIKPVQGEKTDLVGHYWRRGGRSFRIDCTWTYN